MSMREIVKVVRVLAAFSAGSVGTYIAVWVLAFFVPMAYFQSQSEYDVANSGVFFFPLAVLLGLIAAPFGGVGAVVLVERLVKG